MKVFDGPDFQSLAGGWVSRPSVIMRAVAGGGGGGGQYGCCIAIVGCTYTGLNIRKPATKQKVEEIKEKPISNICNKHGIYTAGSTSY